MLKYLRIDSVIGFLLFVIIIFIGLCLIDIIFNRAVDYKSVIDHSLFAVIWGFIWLLVYKIVNRYKKKKENG